MFCYTSKPNNSTSLQVNNYEKVETTSLLPGDRAVDYLD